MEVSNIKPFERRPTSQAQSWNDIFNSMRKKSSTNTPALPDPLPAMSTASDNSDELIPEEHTGEDEGLAEEEISAFYKEYMKVGSSSKILQGMPLKIPVSINSNSGSSGGASS